MIQGGGENAFKLLKPMDSRILSRLDSLDAELRELLDQLADYSEEDLNRSPGPGKWSALQVMQHLHRSEELSLQYLRKKLSNPATLKRAGLMTSLRELFLAVYLDVPLKFKAPKAVSPETFPEGATLDGLGTSWQSLRGQIREFLAAQPEIAFRSEAYKHPLAGRVTLNAMLAFFQGHFRRHRKQLWQAIPDRN